MDQVDPSNKEAQATSADGGDRGAEEIPKAIIPEDQEATGCSSD